MKRGEFDLTGKAVDCSGLLELGDAGKEIFRALKVAVGCENDYEIDFSVIDRHQAIIKEYSVFDMCSITMITIPDFSIAQPSDVLGQAAIDAAMDGATIVFEGDTVPNGMTEYYKSNSEKITVRAYENSTLKDGSDIIAYKLIKKTKQDKPMKLREMYPNGVYTENTRQAYDKFKELLSNDLNEHDEYDFYKNLNYIGLDEGLALYSCNEPEAYSDKATYLTNRELLAIDLIEPSNESSVLVAKVNASDVLSQGAKHLSDRAVTYDSADGERSMWATVEAFKSITGHSLTEEQGWLFMVLLKAVRSQQGNYKLDNYEDGAAYFALMAESASKGRK